MLTIKINLQAHSDRCNMITALAHNGYKVWVEEKKDPLQLSHIEYFVCFEISRDDFQKMQGDKKR